MTILENAFAVLGARPTDDRRVLTQRADEIALLGGSDTEDALNQLMQMNRRIRAELAWFPGASPQAASMFFEYARGIARGKAIRVPSVSGLGTALAQANALSALFEIWPADSQVLFVALCRAMDSILSRITPKETFQAINADRKAGGWEPVPDIADLTGPLNDRLRELCAPVVRALEKLDSGTAISVINELYGPKGIDVQGSVAQAVGDAYSMRIHERADVLAGEIRTASERLGKAGSLSKSDLIALKNRTEEWCGLTAPLRLIAGPLRNEGKGIGHGFRNVLVNYVNKAGTVKKEKQFIVPMVNGYKTVTISYQSQADYVNEAIQMNDWLEKTFPEQLELMAQLKQDREQLNAILLKEQRMLSEAESNARIQATIRR